MDQNKNKLGENNKLGRPLRKLQFDALIEPLLVQTFNSVRITLSPYWYLRGEPFTSLGTGVYQELAGIGGRSLLRV